MRRLTFLIALFALACGSCKFAESSYTQSFECTSLSGTQVSLEVLAGETSTRVVGACTYAASGTGTLFVLSSANGNVWIYLRGREQRDDYVFVNSQFVDAFNQSRVVPDDVLRWLDTQGVTDGSAMMALFATMSDGTSGWYESSGSGVATSAIDTVSGSWPRLPGEGGVFSLSFADVRLRPPGNEWSFANASGVLQVRIGAVVSNISDAGVGDANANDADMLDADTANDASDEATVASDAALID